MTDFERKKTLHQVLVRLRELYRRLYLVSEWSRVSNEHVALKVRDDGPERQLIS